MNISLTATSAITDLLSYYGRTLTTGHIFFKSLEVDTVKVPCVLPLTKMILEITKETQKAIEQGIYTNGIC